jgi:hypothetical protein
MLVECKVSRADFHADRRKATRASYDQRPAWHCWYLTPVRLVSVHELPPGWGLLEWDGRRVRVVSDVPAECRQIDDRRAETLRDEVYRLACELRRYQAQGIRYKTVAELMAGAPQGGE